MIASTWLNLLLLLGTGQGIFMAFLLWQKKEQNAPAVKFLVYLLLLISTLLIGRAAIHLPIWEYIGPLIVLPDVILFAIGPMLYFFIRVILQQGLPSKRSLYWHCLPAFIHVFIINTLVVFHIEGIMPFPDRRWFMWLFFLIEGAAILNMVIYLVWSMQYYRQYRAAYFEKYELPFLGEFLQPLCIGSFLVLGFWTLAYLRNFFLPVPNYNGYLIVWSLLVIVVYYLAYKVLLSPELLQLPPLKNANRKAPDLEVSPQDLAFLETYMTTQKPYLHPELKIGDLAEALNRPPYELSKWINQGHQKNFFDFINTYRIQEFVALRKNPAFEERNTLELAYQSGFNSKSAFNRAFKKATGHSPRAYFKLQSDSLSQSKG